MTGDLAVFRSLKSFSGAGVWKNHLDPKGEYEFAAKTLIYGFNGTGKTTLSRVFASIERGQLEMRLPNTCSFEFVLSDGTTLHSKTLQSPFGKRLLVFNHDFIERNFKWDDSVAEPIFYLSEQSIERKAEYDAAIRDFDAAETRDAEATDAEDKAAKTLGEFKSRIAKRVRDLAPSQRYSQSFDARKIDPTYATNGYSSQNQLNEENLHSRQALLASAEAKPPLTELASLSFTLDEWWKAQIQLLGSSPGTVLAEEFRQRGSALTWISEGLHYHDQHDLANCLLCGNALTPERKAYLAQNFDSRWAAFVEEVKVANDTCSTYLAELRAAYQTLPKEVELQASLQASGKALRPKIEESIRLIGQLLKKLAELLNLKSQNPSLVPEIPDELVTFSGANWLAEFEAHRTTWNGIITVHNREHEEFSARQQRAFEEIRDHVLAEEHADWISLKKEVTDTAKSAKVAAQILSDARRKRDQLGDAMRTHGVGAEKLNKLLNSYLGHADIALRTSNDGYQLIRSDGNPATQLSEGEKAALAFCFFLTQFEAEGRKKKELIAVIDDPISSLDTSARTHAFSLMSRMTKDCRQTIVLTHNMSFMNMVKREFTKNGGVPSSLFQLECVSQAENPNHRSTRLTIMNPLIKDYDTEYHYLFELVFKAARSGASDHHYLLPNATRKLLEMFTAFSAPDQTSFAAALGSSGVQLKKNDPKALERLIQIESHGTMDGLASLPALTVEEAIRATSAAMEFIQIRDKQHFKAMCRVCQVPEEA